jgi:hypothetical protein
LPDASDGLSTLEPTAGELVNAQATVQYQPGLLMIQEG